MKRMFRAFLLVVGLWVVSSVTAPAVGAAGIAGGESVARFLAGLPVAGAQPAPEAQTGTGANRAALVVRYGGGQVYKQCVSFNEESLSGDEILQRSGLVTIIDYNNGIGGAICSIAGQGCSYPSEDCFCRCLGLECEYWAYYYLENGSWVYSQLGAGGRTVSNGGVEGWSWGPGNFSSGTEPPLVSFAEVCADPSTPTPTPTPTATATMPGSGGDTTGNTPVPVRTAPPQVQVTAGNAQISAGQCTLLEWVTWDADQVQLDGQSVLGQDRREVCPSATRRFVLAATNSAGQTVREVTVSVAGALLPTVAPVQTIVPAPTLAAAAPINRVPQPSPVAKMPSPTLAEPGLALVPVVLAQEPAPVQPEPAGGRPVLATLDPALYTAATVTPRPRRVLGADGRATPTPMLVAMAPAAPAIDTVPARPAVSAPAPSRTFSAGLLPGYAAYLLIFGLLAAVGVWVAWRTGASRAASRPGD